MGMDVYGNNPSSPQGEYFRRSVWGWRPLACLCADLAPELVVKCKYWQSNDGDGLDAKASALLARRLTQLVEDGTVERYVADRDAALAALPDEPCFVCEDTDIREADGKARTCETCGGQKVVRPLATNYELHIDDVREFAAFLEACGGFEIC